MKRLLRALIIFGSIVGGITLVAAFMCGLMYSNILVSLSVAICALIALSWWMAGDDWYGTE